MFGGKYNWVNSLTQSPFSFLAFGRYSSGPNCLVFFFFLYAQEQTVGLILLFVWQLQAFSCSIRFVILSSWKRNSGTGIWWFDACCIMSDTHRRRGCKIIYMREARTDLTADAAKKMQNRGWELHCSAEKGLRKELKSLPIGQMLQWWITVK